MNMLDTEKYTRSELFGVLKKLECDKKIASIRVTENIAVNTAASKLRIVLLLDKITTPIHKCDNNGKCYHRIKQHFL